MMARTTIVALLLLGAGLSALAGTASAQAHEVQIQINCKPGPTEIAPLSAPGQYACTATPQATGTVSDPARFIGLSLRAPDAPSWANVIIAPASLSFVYGAGGEGYQSQDFSVSVALTQNAPAFQSSKITITGEAAATGETVSSTSVLDTQITVTPGYFNLYNVRLDQKIGQGGPQDSVPYPIAIDNFSNGETRFEFTLAAPDSVPNGFQPVIPEPTVLQSQATGGETTSGQVTFSVYTPYKNGYVNDVGAIQLVVDSYYAPNTNIKGASSQVSTLTQARGFYVPGPGAPLVAIGILGAALFLARRDLELLE